MNEEINSLINGYHKFKDDYSNNRNRELIQELAKQGQNPKAMVIACSDSRVDPAILLNCKPGDLFVVRNIANIVPPYESDNLHHGTSAALEFGICHLKIKNLIIMGHTGCAGVQAKVQNLDLKPNEFIHNWVSQIETCPNANEQELSIHGRKSLVKSYQNCLTFPWLKEKIDNKDLNLHLWHFDISSLSIHAYDYGKDEFVASI